MRVIDLIVIHCSDSDMPAHDNIETVKSWHVKERGWKDIGYHYFISKDGGLHQGRDEETIGAHVSGFNTRSVGICLSGRHEFTAEQFRELEILCIDLTQRYGLSKSDILGHCELDHAKTCPNFDFKKLLSSWEWH